MKQNKLMMRETTNLDKLLLKVVRNKESHLILDLISLGANPNTDDDGVTPLMISVLNDDIKSAINLVTGGADVNYTFYESNLNLANSPEMAGFLITAGANFEKEEYVDSFISPASADVAKVLFMKKKIDVMGKIHNRTEKYKEKYLSEFSR